MNSAIGLPNIYPLDRDLSGGKRYPPFEQLVPDFDFRIRACLHEGGGPREGEVTCGGLPHLTCKRAHIKMRDYMDRRVTPPWGLPRLPEFPHLHVNRP